MARKKSIKPSQVSYLAYCIKLRECLLSVWKYAREWPVEDIDDTYDTMIMLCERMKETHQAMVKDKNE